MSGLVDFAESELKRLEDKCTDDSELKVQKAITKDIMKIVEEFCQQGHSGTTGSYVLNILERILRFKPIGELTGEDDEWIDLEMDCEPKYQNKRCPAVFKNSDGRAFYTEGKVFSDDNGKTWYSSKDSSIDIEFPYYVPDLVEHVIVDTKEEREDILKDIKEALKETYDELDINDKNIDDITEDSLIRDYVPESKQLFIFNVNVKDKLMLSNKMEAITEDMYFWQLINAIIVNHGEPDELVSNVEEEIKALMQDE